MYRKIKLKQIKVEFELDLFTIILEPVIISLNFKLSRFEFWIISNYPLFLLIIILAGFSRGAILPAKKEIKKNQLSN